MKIKIFKASLGALMALTSAIASASPHSNEEITSEIKFLRASENDLAQARVILEEALSRSLKETIIEISAASLVIAFGVHTTGKTGVIRSFQQFAVQCLNSAQCRTGILYGGILGSAKRISIAIRADQFRETLEE